jgi:hypothetical protein
MIMAYPPFPRDKWYRIPMELRRRYWTETNYGRLLPTQALLDEMEAALAVNDTSNEEEELP